MTEPGMTSDVLVDELISLHHETPCEVPAFTSRFPNITPADAYAAAKALHEHRLALGWRPVGRKIGFTNRTIWQVYGVYEPIWGTVYDQTLVPATNGRATVPLTGLVNPRIEPEVCFRLKSAPPVTQDAEELLGVIEWVAHSVEVVQSHFPGWKFRLPDCIADNGLHGLLVVGTPVPIDQLPGLVERLPSLEVVLRKGASEVDRGVGANVLGSPLLALAHLVEVLSKQSNAPQLQAGEVVTTGVITDAHPVSPGEMWQTEIAGLPLPGLTIRFEE